MKPYMLLPQKMELAAIARLHLGWQTIKGTRLTLTR